MHPSRLPSEFSFRDIKEDYPERSIEKSLASGQITKQDEGPINEYGFSPFESHEDPDV